MTIAVDWDVKHQTKQNQSNSEKRCTAILTLVKIVKSKARVQLGILKMLPHTTVLFLLR